MKTGYKSNAPSTLKGYSGDAAPMPETFSLSAEQLPALKNWKVGKTYDLAMTVKLVGQRNDSMDNAMRGTFEIQDVTEDDSEDNGGDNGND